MGEDLIEYIKKVGRARVGMYMEMKKGNYPRITRKYLKLRATKKFSMKWYARSVSHGKIGRRTARTKIISRGQNVCQHYSSLRKVFYRYIAIRSAL